MCSCTFPMWNRPVRKRLAEIGVRHYPNSIVHQPRRSTSGHGDRGVHAMASGAQDACASCVRELVVTCHGRAGYTLLRRQHPHTKNPDHAKVQKIG